MIELFSVNLIFNLSVIACSYGNRIFSTAFCQSHLRYWVECEDL